MIFWLLFFFIAMAENFDLIPRNSHEEYYVVISGINQGTCTLYTRLMTLQAMAGLLMLIIERHHCHWHCDGDNDNKSDIFLKGYFWILPEFINIVLAHFMVGETVFRYKMYSEICIRYIYCWNLPFLNGVIIVKSKILLPQA